MGRHFVLSVAALLWLTWPSALRADLDAQAPAPPLADPERVIAAVRAALGGDSRIGGVTSFVATGRTRQVQGDNLVPIEFEIACELPDRCVRRDEVPARGSGPTTVGFNGTALIQSLAAGGMPGGAFRPPGALPGRGGPPPSPDALRAGRLAAVRHDIARLTLGMFAGSIASFPVAFAWAGEAEAPQGQADVLDVTGPDAFAVRFFVFKETHLPIMVSWQAPGPPGSPGPSEAAGAGTTVEHRLFYADYRDVDGLKLPFRLRRATGAETVEETTFDRYRINTRIDPRRFEVRP